MNEPTRKLNIEAFQESYRQVFCYGWYRDGRYLYIGMTANGISRLQQHQIIGRQYPVMPQDEIHFWDVIVDKPEIKPSEMWQLKKNIVVDLERQLIEIHRPEYNVNTGQGYKLNGKPSRVETKAFCGHCKIEFLVTREWNLYCSKKCQIEAYHVKKRTEANLVKCICMHCRQEYFWNTNSKEKNGNYCEDCRKLVGGQPR